MIMMNEQNLKYFRIIGQIQSIIAKSKTLDEAMEEGLKTILNNSAADYAILWSKDDNNLRPAFWICPIDITSKRYKPGKGAVGKTFTSKKPTRILDYKNHHDKELDELYKDIKISSYICLPVSNKYDDLGCIEFIKENDEFSEDEADVCELLTGLVSLQMEDEEKFDSEIVQKDTILTARNIIKDYQNGEIVSRVLKGVNLDVYKGEFLVLLGESGCGKSTLLNIISGMDNATSGEVKFMDKDITKASQDELTEYRRENIGFIFQSYNLMPNLTVYQNLQLIAELVDKPMDIMEALKLVKLEDKKDSYPSQLSGGQQQRVSIARALIKNPKIIMADEPTAALDYETSIEVLSALEKIKKAGTTLVMVTHNEEITRMCDRVVRFRSGKTYEITLIKHPVPATELVW